MKISFVTPGLGGGGGRVIIEYGRGLTERGHTVRILYGRTKPTVQNVLRKLYQKICYGDRDSWLRDYREERVAFDELTPQSVGSNDAVVAVGANCALAIAELPASCGVKIHNCHGRELGNMERMHAAWNLKMPRIVVASYLEREMRQQGSKDDIFLVHNGVARQEYFPAPPPEGRNGVGAVYHGAYTKGPEVMLQVYQRLHDLRPEVPLFMFGSYPRPAGLPPGTRYVRLPSIDQARALYSSAQVWICTSRSEGFPGPVLEAMACGCPLVVTDCGGTADQIDDGANGFIVPVDDVNRMMERVLMLLDDPGMRARFTTEAEEKLKAFTWPRAVHNLETAIETIVHRSGKPARASAGV